VRREPASENGAVQVWCRCGERTFPEGTLILETLEEWAFVIKRVGRGFATRLSSMCG
jgi:hypothetical protein